MAEALTVVVLVAAFLAVAGVAAVAVYRLWTSSSPDEPATAAPGEGTSAPTTADGRPEAPPHVSPDPAGAPAREV